MRDVHTDLIIPCRPFFVFWLFRPAVPVLVREFPETRYTSGVEQTIIEGILNQ